MKKIYTSLLLLLALICFTSTPGNAQVPDGFNYQAVARNAAGDVLSGANLTVRIAIVPDVGYSTLFWEEEHSVQTNGFGLFTLVIGDPNATRIGGTFSNFEDIDWTSSSMFLRPSIKEGASAWQEMTPSRIVAVPYAILSKDTEAKQQLSFLGDQLALTGGGSADLSKYTSPFASDADTIFKIDGSLSLGSNRPLGSKLAVVSTDDDSDEPLFEVRRKDGQAVFSVYNTGVQIHVEPSDIKGPSRGGFAIGGFESGAKGVFQNYLTVEPDSIRMFIKETTTVKGPSRGGFAIGGFDENKGFVSNYFNVSGKNDVDIYNDVAQMLWYPRKEAFLAGRILIPHPDSVGLNSTSLGYHSMAKGDFSQAFGHETKASGTNSTAIGNQAIARGSDSYAFGSGAKATGERSFAFGSVGVDEDGNINSTITLASGNYSTSLGMGAQSTQTAAMAVGVNALASGYASSALGYFSQASDYYAVSIGYYSKSTNRYAHSFGLKAEASGIGSLALGMYAKSQGNYASSMGYYSEATNQYSVAVGYYAKALADYSAAFGRSAQATGPSSVAIGYSKIASGIGAAALGRTANAGGESSLSLGYSTSSAGLYSTAIGYDATASQPYATAIGYQSQATGQDSYAFGSSAVASATKAVSMGVATNASANYSVAIGNGATASGDYATSLGYLTSANGTKSIAIGAHYNYTYYRFVWNKITGGYTLLPVTVNKPNTASDTYSIAFGNGNTATKGGFALGTNNTARSIGSVAIGFSNYADSAYSFAAGYGNYTRGINSFALGENLTAQASNSFVVGTYNIIEGTKDDWVTTDPLFVVGNGESSSVRSNAFKVSKNGNVWVEGYFQSPGSYNNNIIVGRDAYITSSGYLGTVSSSIRFKENVKSLNDIGWLYDLNPVTFTYIEDEKGTLQYGLIAEEVEKVNKEFVSYGEDGLPETVYYSRFMAPLMKAVQLQKRDSDNNLKLLEELQNENQDLRSQNEELRSRIEQIEAVVNSIFEKQ